MKKRILSLLLITQIIFSCFALPAFATGPQVIDISAENYSDMLGVQALSSDSGNYLYCQTGNYLIYDISAEIGGRFLLSLYAKSSKNAFVNISVDGEMSTNAEVKKNLYYQDVPCFIYLKEGTNKLKLFFASGSVYMYSLRLTKISDEADEKTFLKAINESGNEDEIYEELKTKGTDFGIDADSLLEGIWYKKAVFTHLKDRSYDSAQDVFYDLVKYSSSEKRSPSVILYNGTQKITDFQSGDLKITYKSSRFKKGSSVFCALYETDEKGRKKLFGLDANTEMSGTKLTAEFKGVKISDPEKITWEIFSFEDSEKIVPYDIFDNTYKNIYVSTDGSDLADGSKDTPFATIKRAKEEIAEIAPNMTGDIVVNIEPGTYFLSETEEFAPSHSGKNGYNVIFKGTNEDNPPVFSGGRRLTEWTLYKDGIYSAPLDSDEVRNLYVDGVAQIRARSEYCFTYLEDYDDTKDSTYDLDGFVTSDSGFKDLAYPEDAETVWTLMWRMHRLPLKDIIEENGKKIMLLDADYWVKQYSSTSNSVNLNEGKNYFIENAMEYLDRPGEFYYAKRQKLLFYYPYKEEDLEKCEIVVPVTENLFKVNGNSKTDKVSNIIFDNIKIKYGAWNHVSTYGLFSVQSTCCYDPVSKTERILLPTAQFTINMADNIVIKNCEFSSLGSNAVDMTDGVSNVSLVGNVIKDISGAAITIGTTLHGDKYITDTNELCRNICVENNLMRRIATEYMECPVIGMIYGNGISIKHNDIAFTPYSGMSIGWGWEDDTLYSDFSRNVDISYNKVEDVMQQLTDGGGIYTLGHLYESRITNNFVNRVKDKAYYGIYLDAGSSYLKVYDNLVLGTFGNHMYIQSGYEAEQNHIYRNYTDRVGVTHTSGATEDLIAMNVIEDIIEVSASNLPDEAMQIKTKAGLEEEFSHLYSEVPEIPSYMNYNVGKLPKQVDEGGMVIEAESFYDNYGSGLERVLVYSDCVSYNSGQWLEYTVDIEKAGDYEVIINAATTKENFIFKICVNDGSYKVMNKFPSTGALNKYESHSVGTISLNEGINTIRILNAGGGMHFDYFALKYQQ